MEVLMNSSALIFQSSAQLGNTTGILHMLRDEHNDYPIISLLLGSCPGLRALAPNLPRPKGNPGWPMQALPIGKAAWEPSRCGSHQKQQRKIQLSNGPGKLHLGCTLSWPSPPHYTLGRNGSMVKPHFPPNHGWSQQLPGPTKAMEEAFWGIEGQGMKGRRPALGTHSSLLAMPHRALPQVMGY